MVPIDGRGYGIRRFQSFNIGAPVTGARPAVVAFHVEGAHTAAPPATGANGNDSPSPSLIRRAVARS